MQFVSVLNDLSGQISGDSSKSGIFANFGAVWVSWNPWGDNIKGYPLQFIICF